MRARELNQLLGPKASGQAFDFVLDLHDTTADMGSCLIVTVARNVFAMRMCRHRQVALCPRSAGRGVAVVPLGARPWSWPAAGPPGPLDVPSVSSPSAGLCFLHALPHFPLPQFPLGPDPPICSQLQSPELPCRVFLCLQPTEEISGMNSVSKNGLGGLRPLEKLPGWDRWGQMMGGVRGLGSGVPIFGTPASPHPSQAPVMELGSQPRGVLRADLLTRMRAPVAKALDFIQLFSEGKTPRTCWETKAQRGPAQRLRSQALGWAGNHPRVAPMAHAIPGLDGGTGSRMRSPIQARPFPPLRWKRIGW